MSFFYARVLKKRLLYSMRVRRKRGNFAVQIQELSAELERKYGHVSNLLSLEDAIHVPDIVHSTVMRHAGAPSDAQGLAAGLAELKEKWKPAAVIVREISLAFESHPYMHIGRSEGEMHRFSLP